MKRSYNMTVPNVAIAISVLEKIYDQLGSEYLAYWVAPNAILTLSGARSYMDGVFWDDDSQGLLDSWTEDIAKSSEIINKLMDVLFSNSGIKKGHRDEKYSGYDFVLANGLAYSLSQTKLLQSVNIEQFRHVLSEKYFMDPIITDLQSQSRFDNYSKENIAHIAFGILVGYPDDAILSSVDTREREGENADMHLIDANIEYADYYVAPQPVYEYAKNLAGDPNITSHEKLWSKVLNDYYNSDFHTSLETDSKFQDKLKEIGSIRQ